MFYRALLVALLLASTAFATGGNLDSQNSESTVSGTVHNMSGQAISGARVDIRDIMTGRQIATAYSSGNGAFDIPNVPNGRYEVAVTSKLSETHERIEVQGGAVSVALRLRDDSAENTPGSATISVAQMKVPEKARKHLEKAQDAFRKQDLPTARREVDKALQVYPQYAQALTLRGIMKLQTGDQAGAEDDMTESVRNDYGYALGFVALGSLYNIKHQYDRAIDSLNRALVLQPQTWQGYFELSKAELGRGIFGNALKYVNKAASLIGRDWGPLHLIRGHAFIGMKNYRQATSELEAFLKTDPGDPASAQVREMLDKLKAVTSTGDSGGGAQ